MSGNERLLWCQWQPRVRAQTCSGLERNSSFFGYVLQKREGVRKLCFLSLEVIKTNIKKNRINNFVFLLTEVDYSSVYDSRLGDFSVSLLGYRSCGTWIFDFFFLFK
jgi:hypothetical protein